MTASSLPNEPSPLSYADVVDPPSGRRGAWGIARLFRRDRRHRRWQQIARLDQHLLDDIGLSRAELMAEIRRRR